MLIINVRDYAPNELLDRYSDADINDDEDLPELSVAARRAAEAKMSRRDIMERTGKRGVRAARRSRHEFFDDEDAEDEMDGGLGVSSIPRRTRRQYDERRDIDDLDGIEDVRFYASRVITLVMPLRFRRSHWSN
jgi:DNA replication licensing factor MCM2